MLILTRRSGESIIIGGTVNVTVRCMRSYGCVLDITGTKEPIRKSMSLRESYEIAECEAELTILGGTGSTVRIGINAPKGVSVHREEIQQRIERENAAARKAS